jgi:type I restriction enzyme R subunit
MKYCFLPVISDGVNTQMDGIFTPYGYYYAWNKTNDAEQAENFKRYE